MLQRCHASPFAENTSGNVAILFAILLVPICIIGALAVDYGRVTAVRAQLQGAADAAALAALTSKSAVDEDDDDDDDDGQSAGAMKARAQAYLDANKNRLHNVSIDKVTKTPTSDGMRIDVEATLAATFGAVIGIPDLSINVTSYAKASTEDIELALVLDNTGSMAGVMSDLRTGAKDLVNAMFDTAGNSSMLKVAVVPYTATVNIGNGGTQMGWMDTTAAASNHGISIETRHIGYEPGCVKPGGGSSDPDPGSGTVGSIFEQLPQFAYGLIRLFGISPAQAATAADVPAPFRFDEPCNIGNPSVVNLFELLDLIPNANWKGCVMARPEPFDTTDEPPSLTSPNTRLVPWFWPDETDNVALALNGYTWRTVNDYLPDRLDLRDALPDGDGNVPGKFTDPWVGYGMHNILKYNNTPALIDEVGPDTLGPNKGCPDEIMPLSDNKSSVITKLNSLTHWNGGGTNIALGLAWGWRVLSPQAPFDQGTAYGTTRKVIVLMTDGQNNINPAPNLSNLSEYSAYGFLQEWSKSRFETKTYDGFRAYTNGRLSLTCTNAKAEGITIYTVAFSVTDPDTLDRLSDCATGSAYAYTADTADELVNAFRDISTSLSQLRLAE